MAVPGVVLAKVEETTAYEAVDPRSGTVCAETGALTERTAKLPSEIRVKAIDTRATNLTWDTPIGFY